MKKIKLKAIPTALTIAGSDSGGGAGIQADLKTFAAYGVHGTTAITCITAQNPAGVIGIQACRPDIVSQQIEAVVGELHPTAFKTGMLYSESIIEAVREWRSKMTDLPFVLDPVMVATSGARLLKPAAIRSMIRLLHSCTVVTPNLAEAELLVGRKLKSVEELRAAARFIYEHHGCAALLKGGHLSNTREAMDILFDGRNEYLLTAPYIRGVSTHGTGCTYSAALTAGLAKGWTLLRAATSAKQFISNAIADSQMTAAHTLLSWRSETLKR